MPPALHPRSGFTTSLFGTTLALSFLIVGLPHIIPCPVDPKQYAEGSMEVIDQDGKRIRVRRLPKKRSEGLDSAVTAEHEDLANRKVRECPVPKPGGLIAQVLGLKNEEVMKPVIRVEQSRLDLGTSRGEGS